MKKIFSIILPLMILSGGIVLGFNTQDEPICTVDEHTGYSYTNPGAPPLPFNPAAPLPAGMTNLGAYDSDFRCEENPQEQCHWAYVPASGTESAKWVECQGDIKLPPFGN